jgi:POT family proton-dependent oligopeptide transporter
MDNRIPTLEEIQNLKKYLSNYGIFLVEMWERFCFYGMRVLAILWQIRFRVWLYPIGMLI